MVFLGEEDGEGDRERNDRDLVEAACFEGVESAWDDGQAGAVVVDVVVVVVVVVEEEADASSATSCFV